MYGLKLWRQQSIELSECKEKVCFSYLIFLLGIYPALPGETEIIGLEAAGYLVNSPEEYKSGEYTKNERVMALLPGGGYGDIARVHRDHLIKIPDNLSFEEAAAIPETWLTSYQLLFLVANATKGKTCLVHAAASGIGCAVIQLCKQVGVTTIAVTSNQEKVQFATDLGADYGINYKENPDFSDLVKEYTNGKGVDIILDCIGAQNFEYNLKSAGMDCQWVVYGLMGGPNVDNFNLKLFMAKRMQLLCTTLKSRSNPYKANLIARFTEEYMPLFKTLELRPILDKHFKFSQMAEAHKYMEDNLNKGKIVCVNDMNDITA